MRLLPLGRALLFPPLAVRLVLIPVSAALLFCSLSFLEAASPLSVGSYVLAAYTLTVWCVQAPRLIRFFRELKEKNEYVRRWLGDARRRVNVSLYGSLIFNSAYAALQLGLGIRHRTFWFCSLAGYYITLSVMRFFLVRHTSRHEAGEKMREELIKCRACGRVLLLMNLALSVMVFFMIYWNRTFHHHEITTIALATYTFASLTMAIVGVFKYRKYNSPVYSASKAINLAAASVSMLTLESTMLTTFGADTVTAAFRRTMLGITGGVLSLLIVGMAVHMIVQSNRKLKQIKQAEE